MSKEWLRLIKAERIASEEVEALISVVDVYRHRGSGWFDLALGISQWATSNGFTIPCPHWPHQAAKN